MEGLLAAGVAAWRENGFGCSQVRVYFQPLEGQNVNSGCKCRENNGPADDSAGRRDSLRVPDILKFAHVQNIFEKIAR